MKTESLTPEEFVDCLRKILSARENGQDEKLEQSELQTEVRSQD